VGLAVDPSASTSRRAGRSIMSAPLCWTCFQGCRNHHLRMNDYSSSSPNNLQLTQNKTPRLLVSCSIVRFIRSRSGNAIR
jgi:hypothetical protein